MSNLNRDRQLYKRLLSYLKPYQSRFFLALLASIPAASLDGVFAWMVGPFLDSMIGGKDTQLLMVLPFAVVGVLLLQGLFEYVSDYLTNYVGFAVTRDIRQQLYNQLNKMDLIFFKKSSSGELLTRYYTDPTTLQQAIVTNLQGFIIQFFTAGFLAFVLFYRNWQLAILAIGIISLISIPLYFISKKIRKLDHLSREISARLASLVYESIFGIKEIISFQRQEHQQKRFSNAQHEFFSASMRITKSETILKPIMQGIAGLGVAAILALSFHQIQAGIMTRGDVASFLLALILLYKPIKVIATIIGKIQRILAPAERVFQKIDLQPEMKDPANSVSIETLRTLEFLDVSFHYNSDKAILKNLNFTVRAGETIALVGLSGGGKTTLVELIPRFLDPTVGQILYNGINLKNFSLKDIRSQIALVSQDTVLFSGSIADNIRFGRLSASDAEVEEALRRAYLTDWVSSLPEGIHTQIGERGSLVSGGQKQRISIARAFLKNSPILIMDEATSALDSESEQMVQKAILEIKENRTVFLIAHRLASIKCADRIFVLQDGEIIESGSNDELLEAQGIYHKLYHLQMLNSSQRPESLVIS